MRNPLARYLKQNGLTVGRFAAMSGLDRATVWRIAHGHRGAGIAMAAKLEKATAGAVPMASWVKRRAA